MMSIFYILPPRTILGEVLAKLLRPMMPGLKISRETCIDLVEGLVADSPDADQTYLVHREDLPEGVDLNAVLRDGYGAEPGDQIVQVSVGTRVDEPRIDSWRLEAA